jgi:hypothetical protein
LRPIAHPIPPKDHLFSNGPKQEHFAEGSILARSTRKHMKETNKVHAPNKSIGDRQSLIRAIPKASSTAGNTVLIAQDVELVRPNIVKRATVSAGLTSFAVAAIARTAPTIIAGIRSIMNIPFYGLEQASPERVADLHVRLVALFVTCASQL